MTAATATNLFPFFDDDIGAPDSTSAKRAERYARIAAYRSNAQKQKNESVSIEPYTPYIKPQSDWLSAVVKRVNNSVLIEEYDSEISSEWLSEEIAASAITFFKQGADLLPAEPYIYASNEGELVAEFETPSMRMTSIVSADEVILFAVLESTPNHPKYSRLQLNKRKFRDNLRSFMKDLGAGSNGKKVESNR